MDNKSLSNLYRARKIPCLDQINARHNVLYQEGKIYKIKVEDKIYIDSTCQPFQGLLEHIRPIPRVLYTNIGARIDPKIKPNKTDH